MNINTHYHSENKTKGIYQPTVKLQLHMQSFLHIYREQCVRKRLLFIKYTLGSGEFSGHSFLSSKTNDHTHPAGSGCGETPGSGCGSLASVSPADSCADTPEAPGPPAVALLLPPQTCSLPAAGRHALKTKHSPKKGKIKK